MKKNIRLLCLLGVLVSFGIILNLYCRENTVVANPSQVPSEKALLHNKSGLLNVGQDGKLSLKVSARILDKSIGDQKFKVKVKERIIGAGKLSASEKIPSVILAISDLVPGECFSDITVDFDSGVKIKNMRLSLTPVNIPIDIKLNNNVIEVELSDKNDQETVRLAPFKIKVQIENYKHDLLTTLQCKLGEPQKLDIPASGEFMITVEVANYCGDVIARRTIAYKDGKAENLSSANEKPVILAVSSFLDFTSTAPCHVITTIAARDRVVSDLAQNYDCVIISRANGLTLSTENLLNRLNASGNEAAAGFIPAADYSIIGHFSRNKVLDNGYMDDFITSLFITDLKGKDNKEIKDVFKGEYRTGYNEELVPAIAAKLKLRPKSGKYPSVKEKQLEETWAILPIARLLSSDNFAEAKSDSDLSMKMELALQESGKIKRIVDHNEIDKIMQEAKISMTDGVSESTAAGIARILGAEKVVMGQISKVNFRGDKRYRVDLLLIDGKKALVLDAVSSICEPEFLEMAAANLLMKFTQRKYTIPEFSNQSQEMRIKEAAIYTNFLKGISDHDAADYLAVKEGINLTEAAYMLIKDNPRIVDNLAFEFLYKVMNEYKDVIKTKEEGVKAVALIEKMLENIPTSKELPRVLIWRANAQLLGGNYEKSISLVDRYLKEVQVPIDIFAYFLKARAYYSMGDYAKVLELAKKCKKEYYISLSADAYRMLKDEANEFKIIDENGSRSLDMSVRFMILARKFKGAEYALNQYDKLPFFKNPEMRLEAAKSHLQLNNKNEAAILLNGLKDAKLSSSTDKTVFLKEVNAALKSCENIKIDWKTANQIKKIPDNYKFYIRPIGNPDMSIINDTTVELEKLIGVKVIVLPCIPMPDDSDSYVKTYGQYNIKFVKKSVIRVFPVPDDAIALIHITECELYNGAWSYDLDRGAFVSYVPLGGILKKEYGSNLSKMISRLFIEIAFTVISNPNGDRECNNLPCVVAGEKPKELGNIKGEMCPDCQMEYAKVDFGKLNYLWRSMGKNLPPLNNQSSEAQSVRMYKEKVEKYSAEKKK